MLLRSLSAFTFSRKKKKNQVVCVCCCFASVSVYHISIFLAKCLLKCETNSRVHSTGVGGTSVTPSHGSGWVGRAQSLESNDYGSQPWSSYFPKR